jgi:hypothetical protein
MDPAGIALNPTYDMHKGSKVDTSPIQITGRYEQMT